MKIILTPLFIMTCFMAGAQSAGFEIRSGFASYNMSQLKESMRVYTRRDVPDLKLTNDYPGTIPFAASIYLNVGHWQAGGDFSWYTTGARKHYKDYSGEVGYDQEAVAKAFGGFCRYHSRLERRIRAELSMAITYYSSRVTFNEYLRTAATQTEKRLEVVSGSVVITPAVGMTYDLTDYIYTGARIGYAFDTNGKLHLSGDNDSELTDQDGDAIYTDWSGLRTELFIGFRMGDISEKP